MRTTVTLEPHLAAKIKDLAQRRNTSFKVALNDVLRRGLSASGRAAAARFAVEPHEGGFRPGVDPRRLNQLVDELAVEGFVAKHRAP